MAAGVGKGAQIAGQIAQDDDRNASEGQREVVARLTNLRDVADEVPHLSEYRFNFPLVERFRGVAPCWQRLGLEKRSAHRRVMGWIKEISRGLCAAQSVITN